MELKESFKSKRIQIIFLLAGAIGGFLYWRFVGCNSGTCAINRCGTGVHCGELQLVTWQEISLWIS
jgi:hypothetical protein